MPVCARAIQQSDGSYLLGLDPSVTNPTTCAYVVETGAESFMGSLLTLTPEQALELSGAVGLLWAVAWVIREVVRFLREKENVSDD
jgi:hypothetical protein